MLTRSLLTIFLISNLLGLEFAASLAERKAETTEEIEENTIFIACLYLSKSYIKASKKETEASFTNLQLSQDKFYIKYLVLTFNHCKKNMKFEETSEVKPFFKKKMKNFARLLMLGWKIQTWI